MKIADMVRDKRLMASEIYAMIQIALVCRSTIEVKKRCSTKSGLNKLFKDE
jgi:hypothetical protein